MQLRWTGRADDLLARLYFSRERGPALGAQSETVAPCLILPADRLALQVVHAPALPVVRERPVAPQLRIQYVTPSKSTDV